MRSSRRPNGRRRRRSTTGYITTLAYFEDPVLVDRGLARLLSDEVRSQDAASYLRAFLANPNGGVNRAAWTFVKKHWTALLPKLSIPMADAGLVGALGSFCDAGARDDIKAFFTANPRPAAARALDQTIERINGCIQLKEKQGPGVGRWLDELGIKN